MRYDKKTNTTIIGDAKRKGDYTSYFQNDKMPYFKDLEMYITNYGMYDEITDIKNMAYHVAYTFGEKTFLISNIKNESSKCFWPERGEWKIFITICNGELTDVLDYIKIPIGICDILNSINIERDWDFKCFQYNELSKLDGFGFSKYGDCIYLEYTKENLKNINTMLKEQAIYYENTSKESHNNIVSSIFLSAT